MTSPNLIITYPTIPERTRTWTATHPNWGGALTLQNYLERENYLLDIPLARNGGLTQWILTEDSAAASTAIERPVLSTCDTLRKRALFRGKDGVVREAWAHGVGSVFTYPEYRGKGYGAKLMSLLGETLAKRQREKEGEAVCSILFSDIGKKFYGNVGWKPFESTHLAFLATATAEVDAALSYISNDDIPLLASVDEQLIRKTLAAPNASPAKTRVAILPDTDTLLWHMHREDFMCKHIFSRTPSARGVLYTPPGRPNSRVWAIWMRGFYGGLANPEKNTLHFLRFVVENGESMADEELSKAVGAIVRASQSEAQEWLCPNLELWNPEERIRKLVADMPDLGGKFVVRESDEICSLNWFGEGSTEDVEWIANEKFAWC